MNSPESEEPTTNTIPQEEIVVFPRSASHTPRVISRPLSAASNWSHMSKEESETSPSPSNPPINYRNAASGKTLPDPIKVTTDQTSDFKVDLTNTESTSESTKFFHDNNTYMTDEIIREVNEASLGYGMYYLNEPKLTFREDHDSVVKPNQFQSAILLVTQALDAGTANHAGETTTTLLTPDSWFRLASAIIAAILRGKIRSPSDAIKGGKPINTNDTFDIYKDLQHPTTQGECIKRMALQLAESFDNSRRNLAKQSPAEFYDQILDLRIKTLTKAAEAQAKKDFNPSTLTHNIRDDILNDKDTMDKIHEEVKMAIFAELNKEAMEDLDTWREIYREEFKEVMQQYIALNKFGMDPCFVKADPKGKKRAKSATPETENSIREIEHIMRIDCQAQIDAMRNNTLHEMTLQMQSEITAYKTAEFTRLQAEALQNLETEIEAIKDQHRQEHLLFVNKHREYTREQIKAWKVNHLNARKFDFIRREAKNLGYSLIADSQDTFKLNSDLVEASLEWLSSSRPSSRASSRALLRSVGRTSGDRTRPVFLGFLTT
ncbi:hypothetical protein EDB87DRAFT_1684540 [Lactarius vividus]|nr:hypothetical protein EDB87DRAFT_1684540 [Lactarius vividus]